MSIIKQKPFLCGIAVSITVDDAKNIQRIFKDILNFDVIYENDRQEYVLNCPQLSKHLFLHVKQDITCVDKFSEEHLLIFYLNNLNEYILICDLLALAGVKKEIAINPYWNDHGSVFLINDTLRIIFCPGGYKNYKARIAAPAADLEVLVNSLKSFGLSKFDEFENHKNFDGVMLKSQLPIDIHLEFTHFKQMPAHKPPKNYSTTLFAVEFYSNSKLINIDGHVFHITNINDPNEWVQACLKKIVLL
jgi:hypothetical protein